MKACRAPSLVDALRFINSKNIGTSRKSYSITCTSAIQKDGPCRDSNPGPPAFLTGPKAGIIPLDHMDNTSISGFGGIQRSLITVATTRVLM